MAKKKTTPTAQEAEILAEQLREFVAENPTLSVNPTLEEAARQLEEISKLGK